MKSTLKKTKHIFVILLLVFISHCTDFTLASEEESYVIPEKGKENFALFASEKSARLWVSSQDHPGVIRVLKLLQKDISQVCGNMPVLSTDAIPEGKEIVLVGTLGKCPILDDLVKNKKLDIDGISGKWESCLIQVIDKPFPKVERALVIAGSDKRGTIYGIFDLAEKIGVSPWYWWADVPVKKKSDLYILPGRHTLGEPAVKYRGIFINDEAPALSGWAIEKFGGFNSKFYENVFELILRLKGNFLWPAMWGRAFYVDDPLNPKLADEYGIVIGTSHHEPMMRAHAEWSQFGAGPWNYETNESRLRDFWTEGIQRMGNYESIVTLAMRGDGDEPMTEEANIALLQRIVKDQREILTRITGKEPTSVPQVWALYKEVQEYYDKGMRVPEDITLLLCDDNWGNIRKLPQISDSPRPGGYGIYYHYDYVGGPRNYKWLNTNQISRVWEQMHLAYRFGVNRIWIVNVGDIKPMEFPIEFFLDYAWDPEKINAEQLPDYTRRWVKKQFGAEHSQEIAEILNQYTKFNSRRKPELLYPETYSLVNYREAETVVREYNDLAEKAQVISKGLPAEYKDAFYQLVLHPVTACANLNELYVTAGKNHLYARQGRASTNHLAEETEKFFKKDAEITHYYNNILADGKWNHLMDQTHIGYTYWQQPEVNAMPEVKKIDLLAIAEMGVAIEGSENWWPLATEEALLPEFDRFNQQSFYFEIFNRGTIPFDYEIQVPESWIKINKTAGKIESEERLWISIDWEKAPAGRHKVPISISGPNDVQVMIQIAINNPAVPANDLENRFVESNGYITIEAEHYSRAVNTHPIIWQKIPNLGRTLSAITPFPVTAPPQPAHGDSPRLEFRTYHFTIGEVTVKAFLSPTLNFHHNQGLRYAVSFDNAPPQIVNMHADRTFQDWEQSVSNNITIGISRHVIPEPGQHVLKFWAVDPGVVLQKLVIETGQLPPSYLGPPESIKWKLPNSNVPD